MVVSQEAPRDLAGLVVVRAGLLVSTGDVWQPWRLLDPSHTPVVAVDAFLRDLNAAGRSSATQRSYGLALLRWFRFLWSAQVAWNQATQAEARDFSVWIRLVDKPDRTSGRLPKPRPNPVTGKVGSGRKYAAATQAHSETVLRSFYEFHREAGTGPHAEKRLGYNLAQSHTAAVIWGRESNIELSDLDRAVELLMGFAYGNRSLSVLAGADTRWLWWPGANGPDLAGIVAAMGQLPGVRVAIGSTAMGIEGFRLSHYDAITTQRVMTRLGPNRQVARFTDIQPIALISADTEQMNRFIKHTLGAFESADLASILHESQGDTRLS